MTPLPYLSTIQLSGADAGDFLHNQLSADVLALSDNDSVFACYCEPKGRVLALMLVCRFNESYYVVMSSALCATVSSRLKMYVMRSKVNIEVLDEIAVTGTDAEQAPVSPSGSFPVIPVPDSNQWLSMTDASQATEDTGPQDIWKMSELRRGINWLCPQTSGQFLPQMLGFDKIGAVNYRKGCYPGQEIVARTHYLGKVKRHPRLLCTSEVISPDPLEKVRVYSAEKPDDAVMVDRVEVDGVGGCLFVISRMDPELVAGTIEYQGLVASVLNEAPNL